MNNKNKYSIDAQTNQIPEVGLGTFVKGYASQREPFLFKSLWLLLIPIAGWVAIAIYLLFWCIRWIIERFFGYQKLIYLYENGFLWKNVPIKFGTPEDIIIRFDEIGGIRNSKTKNYSSIYGIKHYSSTIVGFEICGISGNTLLSLGFSYHNEFDNPEKYDFYCLATKTILDVWNEISLTHLNAELRRDGYCSFITRQGKKTIHVLVGKNFIQAGTNCAKLPFRYSLDNGYLHLWTNVEGKSSKDKHFTININSMYDKELFLLVATQVMGLDFK